MNQDQYRGLIDILEQQNNILKGITPDDLIEGNQEMSGEMFTTGVLEEENQVNIQVETSTPLVTKGKTELDS
jgi:hypothetical protein